jgi:hypothetical protein
MKGDKSKIYSSADDFYALEGNYIMILKPYAALEVCQSALSRGLLISRIEGGVWDGRRFQPMGDCIWDGVDPPVQGGVALINNAKACGFIEEASKEHNAFVLTTAPVS